MITSYISNALKDDKLNTRAYIEQRREKFGKTHIARERELQRESLYYRHRESEIEN